jgi:uncharacterized protein YjbJ (UPF0337 family)
MGEKIGKTKEVVGYATGDRKVEAKGRVEEKIADPDAPITEETEEAIGKEELDVRKDHGEYRPDPGRPDPGRPDRPGSSTR